MTTPESNSDAKFQAAVALLSDADEVIASKALEIILRSGRGEEVLATLQDSTDENARRHAQQLGSMIQQERLLQHMVKEYEQARLDILTALTDIDLLYDTSSSLPYLKKLLQELLDNFKPRKKELSLKDVTSFMDVEGFYVPPLPWFAIEGYLLGDVLSGDGLATPLVLAVLCQTLGRAHGINIDIAICNGFVCVIYDEVICTPEHGWRCRKLAQEDEVINLNNQQLLQLYLHQLLVSSIATWEAYDVHLFLEILQRLYGIQDNPLPYPFGPLDVQKQDTDQEKSPETPHPGE